MKSEINKAESPIKQELSPSDVEFRWIGESGIIANITSLELSNVVING